MCTIEDYERLELDEESRQLVRNELEEWHRVYLPDGQGMVIDVGAGCGETVLFYLLHTQGRIVAFEQDPAKLALLERNFAGNSRVVVVPGRVGCVKMDIEGGEKGSMIALHGGLHFVEKNAGSGSWEHEYKIEGSL